MIRRVARLLVFVSALPGVVSAQERSCAYDAPGRTTQTVVAGDTVVIVHDPFTVDCTDGAQLSANSGEANRALSEYDLHGDVFFQDSIQSLTSDDATYNAEIGRLFATGNVVFTNREEGSTLHGPELEYFRANDDRPSQVTASQRPTLVLQPRDSMSDEEPLYLIADRVLIMGQNDLTATGDVLILRTDLTAKAGQAQYDSETEELELRDNASLESENFTLGGEIVQARLADGSIQHVHSRTNASLAGEDLRVTAPDLQLFFANDSLQRAVATIASDTTGVKAKAESETFRLMADSLDATFTSQRIDQVYAVGNARGESIDTLAVDTLAAVSPPLDPPALGPPALDPQALEPPALDSVVFDSAGAKVVEPPARTPDVIARDWITGDTIVGYFEPVEADSTVVFDPAQVDDPGTRSVEIRRLVALGSAQSLYRMTPAEQRGDADARKNVNFLVGDRIELELAEGELRVASVAGLRQGVFLEAVPPDEEEPPTDPDAPDENQGAPDAPDENQPADGDQPSTAGSDRVRS